MPTRFASRSETTELIPVIFPSGRESEAATPIPTGSTTADITTGSRNFSKNTPILTELSSRLAVSSLPIRQILPARCARPATGHATAAPPSSVMNWRLLTRSPRRRHLQRERHLQAERLSGLEIDDQLEFGWLQDR